MEKEFEKLAALQRKLARRVVLRDALALSEITTVGGVDEAFAGKKIFSAIVCTRFPSLEVVEKRFAVARERFPYVPTFLSFREAPAVIKVFNKLRRKPDVLFVNGCGVNHPRACGLASHVGVLLNQPTVGVTQSLLCGEVKGNKVFLKNRVVGFALKRKQFAPVYVAPGHKISLETTRELTKRCLRARKLPEPLALAHDYANATRAQSKGL